MKFIRMPIEVESPEQMGYENVKFNLTESSVSDAVIDDLKIDLRGTVLGYGDHLGYKPLRKSISVDFGVTENDVLVTAGAASALFIIHTSILTAQDQLLVMHPNYGTNIETPRAIGTTVDFISLKFENGYKPDFDEIKKQITKQTKIISITNPHNPTGVCLTLDELKEFISLAKKHKCYLLVDETYRELTHGEKLPVAATLADCVISVSSLSKAYGLPGIRMGWIISKNKALQNLFLAAKEQIFICNSLLDETVAHHFLRNKMVHQQRIKKHTEKNFSILKTWITNETRMEWVEPTGGVVSFPRIKKSVKINIEKFYQTLNLTHKTFVGPGHWFEMDKRYMRIGYGWPTSADLKQGLSNVSAALDETTK
ncbi:MAG: aminotransferase class I/II-fold pyridoxal phosphate-dependent enzyme [Flavobacteriales bacterium]